MLGATCWLSFSAVAQVNVPLGDFEACAELASDADQLACFREALDRNKGEQAAESVPAQTNAPAVDVAAVPDIPEEPPAAVQATATPSVAPTVDAEPVPEPTEIEESKERVASSAAPESDQNDALHATVSGVRRTVYGKIVATLDNGQIWQETDGSYYRGDIAVGATVVISKRRFGGHQMKVAEQPGVVLVRRTR